MKRIRLSTLETIKDTIVAIGAGIILLWFVSMPILIIVSIFFKGAEEYINSFFEYSLWVGLWALVASIAFFILMPVFAVFYPVLVILKYIGLILISPFIIDDREKNIFDDTEYKEIKTTTIQTNKTKEGEYCI